MDDTKDKNFSRRKALARISALAIGAYAAPAFTTLSVARASDSSGGSDSGGGSAGSSDSASSVSSMSSVSSGSSGSEVSSDSSPSEDSDPSEPSWSDCSSDDDTNCTIPQ